MAATKAGTLGRSSRATESARAKAKTTVVGVVRKRTPMKKARGGKA